MRTNQSIKIYDFLSIVHRFKPLRLLWQCLRLGITIFLLHKIGGVHGVQQHLKRQTGEYVVDEVRVLQ